MALSSRTFSEMSLNELFDLIAKANNAAVRNAAVGELTQKVKSSIGPTIYRQYLAQIPSDMTVADAIAAVVRFLVTTHMTKGLNRNEYGDIVLHKVYLEQCLRNALREMRHENSQSLPSSITGEEGAVPVLPLDAIVDDSDGSLTIGDTVPDGDHQPLHAQASSNPVKRLLDEEKREQLLVAINLLPPRMAQAVRMRYIEEISYKEIEDSLAVTSANARRLVCNGMLKLREQKQISNYLDKPSTSMVS